MSSDPFGPIFYNINTIQHKSNLSFEIHMVQMRYQTGGPIDKDKYAHGYVAIEPCVPSLYME